MHSKKKFTPKCWDESWKDKFILPSELEERVKEIKESSKTIVTLNGSFDLLHAGHLHIIYEASKLADVLIIGLNSDQSIKSYKAKDRPIIPLEERMKLIAALEFVDYVTSFEEENPKQFLTVVKPTVHVNGAEYGEDCIEAETVKTYGGKIHLVEKIEGFSTSEIINKIHQLRM